MVGARARTRFDGGKVRRAAKRGSIESLGHAGAAIRLTARRRIKKAPRARGRDEKGRFVSAGGTIPSPPGKPPHTRRGQLKRAIVYAVEKERQDVVVGPDYAVVGPSAMAHEHGGRFRGARYEKRPFMGPALEKVRDRLPKKWAGSVRG